jgi:hypothetical protein
MRAEVEWAERTGTKLAVTRLAEALDIFAELMEPLSAALHQTQRQRQAPADQRPSGAVQ